MDIGALICYKCGKQSYHSINDNDLCPACQELYDNASNEEKREWAKQHLHFKEWQADMRKAIFGD